jgi:hypothetical protein
MSAVYKELIEALQTLLAMAESWATLIIFTLIS